jgi:glycosyltransferase involved in cell wall biosynthesis
VTTGDGMAGTDATSTSIDDGTESPLMRRASAHLSVVVGCYNAAVHLEKRLLDLVAFLDGTGRDYEVLIVEDGSLDDSLPILRRLEVEVPSIVVLRNPRNMGKGYSIRNGILNSRGKFIIFTDIDMAYARQNLLSVLERLEAGDPLVVGNRRLPESVYVVNNTLVKYVYRRHRMGVAFNALVRLLFGLTTRDTQSGLKGFSRSAAAAIFQQLYTDGFLFDIEIFIRARTLGIPVTEVPVQLTYEDDITTAGQFRHLVTVIPELLQIKMLERRGAYGRRVRGPAGEAPRAAAGAPGAAPPAVMQVDDDDPPLGPEAASAGAASRASRTPAAR